MKPPVPTRRDTVWITDAAAVTALGRTIEDTWQGLIKSKTAIRPVERFRAGGYRSDVAACIPDLGADESGSRLSDLLRRLVLSMGEVPSDARLITATTKGGIDVLERFIRNPPSNVENVLPSAIDRLAADVFGLKRQAFTISAACASSAIAVSQACAFIHAGETDAALVCCADLVTEFVFSGFSALGALSPTPCTPFDRDREGLSLGEGAAGLLLMPSARAKAEGKRCLGRILGWGSGCDAFHLTTPAPDGTGLIAAMDRAFERAKLSKDAVGVICAHGTGTVSNDAMELTAYDHVFGRTWPPVYSMKGAVGHTLGAGGGIEVAIGLKALSQRIAPPTVGLSHPVEAARGRVTTQNTPFDGDVLLSCNSGFGGINTALIVQRGDG